MSTTKESSKTCRLCLGQVSLGYSLLEEPYGAMLQSLTSIKVDESDGLSQLACLKCIMNLKFAFNIQQSMLKSNEKLKGTVGEIEIKKEVNEDAIQFQPELMLVKPEPKVPKIKLCNLRCIICRVQVKEDHLSKHIQQHFNTKQTCEFCGDLFETITDYQSHIQVAHNSHKKYCCPYCGTNFKYGPFYKIHVQSHEEHAPSRARSLGIRTKHATQLLESQTRAPSKARLLGIRSKYATQLLDTVESSPGVDVGGPFTCPICNKQFKKKRNFSGHTHDKKKCPICQAMISKSNLRKHVLNHTSGPQICELCGATLRSLESLRGHMTHTHSTRHYQCEECGKAFKKKYPYLLHKKKHAGEKGHVCETCGKGFLTLYNLNKHIRMAHLKLRPHICEYCQKAFSSRFALRTHVRQHTNETPYKCEYCGEGFRQNVSLRAHRKSKHNIIEPKTCACTVCGKEFGCEQAIISHMRLH